MKLTRFTVPVPGADRVTLARVLPMGAITLLALIPLLGMQAATLIGTALIIGTLLLYPLLRRFGVPIRNDVTDAESNGNVIMSLIAALTIVGGLLFVGPGLAVFFTACIAAFNAAFRPAAAAALLLFASAFVSGPFVLLAAAATVFLARRDLARVLGFRTPAAIKANRLLSPIHERLGTGKIATRPIEPKRAVARGLITAVAVLAAYLLAQLFLRATAGEPDRNSPARPESPQIEGDGVIARLMRYLLEDGVDFDIPSRPIDVPDQIEPESSLLWWIVAAAATAAALLVAWTVRRRNRGGLVGDPNAAPSLRRLEAVGEAIGRPRKPSEGALSFADRLGGLTGDTRLSSVGSAVSGQTYQSATADPAVVQAGLTTLEAEPPPPPPRIAMADRMRRAQGNGTFTLRGAALIGAGLVLIGTIGWFGWTRASDLGSQPTELAYRSGEAFPGLQQLSQTNTGDLVGWEVCSAFNGISSRWSSGLVHRTLPLGATLSGWAQSESGTITVRQGAEETSAAASISGTTVLLNESMLGSSTSGRTRMTLDVDWTTEDLLAQMSTDQLVESNWEDRNGDQFRRFETLPARPLPTTERLPFITAWDTITAIDVWEHDGVVSRIRIMSLDGADSWEEWRRIDDVASPSLSKPDCVFRSPFANAHWIGSEAWTASRSAPPLVATDSFGNPFDLTSLAYSADAEIESMATGSISGPVDQLAIGDLDSVTITEYSPSTEPLTRFDLGWPQGASLRQITVDGTPAATIVQAAGTVSDDIVGWGDYEWLGIYESFAALSTGDFGPIDESTLDDFLVPFWEGSDLEQGDFDGQPGLELTMVTQSSASVAVPGVNAEGDIIAIAIWDEDHPWRLLALHPEAPGPVLEREAELRECLDGTRPFLGNGRCTWG